MNFALRCRPRFPSWWRPGWLVAIAALTASPCFAGSHDADNPAAPPKAPHVEQLDADDWKEESVPLPPFPRAEYLMPLRHDEVDSGYLYYVDVTSVARDADEGCIDRQHRCGLIHHPIGDLEYVCHSLHPGRLEVRDCHSSRIDGNPKGIRGRQVGLTHLARRSRRGVDSRATIAADLKVEKREERP